LGPQQPRHRRPPPTALLPRLAGHPASEKGIDVALAIDIAMGMDNAYDAAILVSSDTDLLPAIEAIVARTLGHIELATWAGARRLRFPNTQLPWCHFISEQEYRTLEDVADYTQP